MEKPSRGRQEGLEGNHWSYRDCANKLMAVVKRFSPSSNRAGKKALMVPRRFTVRVQPGDEAFDYTRHIIRAVLIDRTDDWRRMTDNAIHTHQRVSFVPSATKSCRPF